MKSLACALCISIIAIQGCTYRHDEFEALTVPAEALPAGCEPAARIGLPSAPAKYSNPATIIEPTEISMLTLFGLEADPGSSIKAAYLAGYYDKSEKENAVWAFQFRDPQIASDHFERLSKKYKKFQFRYYDLRDSILVFAWTDNRDDSSCFVAIQEYLKSNQIREG